MARLSGAPAPAHAPLCATPHSQSQAKQTWDTLMGSLEHRLKIEGQQEASVIKVSDYDAWVHGDTGHHPLPAQNTQKAWGSGPLQSRTWQLGIQINRDVHTTSCKVD
jgi:hypothetical protein